MTGDMSQFAQGGVVHSNVNVNVNVADLGGCVFPKPPGAPPAAGAMAIVATTKPEVTNSAVFAAIRQIGARGGRFMVGTADAESRQRAR